MLRIIIWLFYFEMISILREFALNNQYLQYNFFDIYNYNIARLLNKQQ